MKSSFIYVYALVDPRTEDIRYIGCALDVEARYWKHKTDNRYEKTYKANWLRQLFGLSLEPIRIVLDETSKEDWRLVENAWISFGIEGGWPLTNLTLGGDGLFGFCHSDETRDKMREAVKNNPKRMERVVALGRSKKGTKCTEGAKDKNRKAHKGKILSEQHKKNISLSHKNNPKMVEHARQLGMSGRGKEKTESHKKKIGLSLQGEKHPNAKISDKQVLQIREMYAKNTKICNIARELKISRQVVGDVVHYRRWKHVE